MKHKQNISTPLRSGYAKLMRLSYVAWQNSDYLTMVREGYGEEGVYYPPQEVTFSGEDVETLRNFLNDNLSSIS